MSSVSDRLPATVVALHRKDIEQHGGVTALLELLGEDAGVILLDWESSGVEISASVPVMPIMHLLRQEGHDPARLAAESMALFKSLIEALRYRWAEGPFWPERDQVVVLASIREAVAAGPLASALERRGVRRIIAASTAAEASVKPLRTPPRVLGNALAAGFSGAVQPLEEILNPPNDVHPRHRTFPWLLRRALHRVARAPALDEVRSAIARGLWRVKLGLAIHHAGWDRTPATGARLLALQHRRDYSRNREILEGLESDGRTVVFVMPWNIGPIAPRDSAAFNGGLRSIHPPPGVSPSRRTVDAMARQIAEAVGSTDMSGLLDGGNALRDAIGRLSTRWAHATELRSEATRIFDRLRPDGILVARGDLYYQAAIEGASAAGIGVITLPHAVVEWFPEAAVAPRRGLMHASATLWPGRHRDWAVLCSDVLVEHQYPIASSRPLTGHTSNQILVLADALASDQRLDWLADVATAMRGAADFRLKGHPAGPSILGQPRFENFESLSESPPDSDLMPLLRASQAVVALYVTSAIVHAVRLGIPTVLLWEAEDSFVSKRLASGQLGGVDWWEFFAGRLPVVRSREDLECLVRGFTSDEAVRRELLARTLAVREYLMPDIGASLHHLIERVRSEASELREVATEGIDVTRP